MFDQLVCFLIFQYPTVCRNIVPADLLKGFRGIFEFFEVCFIGHGLPSGGYPTPLLPYGYPLLNAVQEEFGICMDSKFLYASLAGLLDCRNNCLHFGGVVGLPTDRRPGDINGLLIREICANPIDRSISGPFRGCPRRRLFTGGSCMWGQSTRSTWGIFLGRPRCRL